MTVSSTTTRVTYTGNGVTTAFATTFPFFGAALTKAGKFVQVEGAAAAASATVLDPLEERLSNTWQELGLPQNALTDYLAASPDDTKAEGRLKNAIESLALGSILGGGLALSAKVLRAAKQAITPKTTIAGAMTGAGLITAESSEEGAGRDGEASQETKADFAIDDLANPYTGGGAALAFAGSNLSVNTRRARREWEAYYGESWPWDEKTGRAMEVHHITPLADGGRDHPTNVQPLPHDEHMRLHMEAGDFARWRKGQIAGKNGRTTEALGDVVKNAAKAVGPVVTRGKVKG